MLLRRYRRTEKAHLTLRHPTRRALPWVGAVAEHLIPGEPETFTPAVTPLLHQHATLRAGLAPMQLQLEREMLAVSRHISDSALQRWYPVRRRALQYRRAGVLMVGATVPLTLFTTHLAAVITPVAIAGATALASHLVVYLADQHRLAALSRESYKQAVATYGGIGVLPAWTHAARFAPVLLRFHVSADRHPRHPVTYGEVVAVDDVEVPTFGELTGYDEWIGACGYDPITCEIADGLALEYHGDVASLLATAEALRR